MKKAIVFLRVSTQQQTLEQQKQIMMQIALSKYSEDEIAIIQGKESATKLSADERRTLNELYDIVNNNPIEVVYFFAVDRLARKATIVNETVKDLAAKGIDCYFYNPYRLHSLDGDGKLSLMADLMLYFLGIGAEQETLLRTERIAAKRELMRANNQVITGTVLFGYCKKDDKTIGVDEENEAKIVRYVFNEYKDGKKSLRVIAKELIEKGVIPHKNKSTDYSKIRNIILNPAYSGRKPLKGCNVYPPIVSVELQDKCWEILNENKTKAKTESKHVYLAKGFVRSVYSDKCMIAQRNRKVYSTNKDDDVQFSVSINVIDSIVWTNTIIYYSMILAKNTYKNKEDYSKQIEEYRTKIKNVEGIIEDLNGQFTRIYRQYMKGNVIEEQYEKDVADIKKDQAKYHAEIAKYETVISQLENMIDSIDTQKTMFDYQPNIREVDDDTKQKFAREVFESIYVEKMVDGKFKIQCVFKEWIKQPSFYYEYWSRGGVQHLIMVMENGLKTNVSHNIIKRL